MGRQGAGAIKGLDSGLNWKVELTFSVYFAHKKRTREKHLCEYLQLASCT